MATARAVLMDKSNEQQYAEISALLDSMIGSMASAAPIPQLPSLDFLPQQQGMQLTKEGAPRKRRPKQVIPDTLKDEKYWARRLKNTLAARSSRAARRLERFAQPEDPVVALEQEMAQLQDSVQARLLHDALSQQQPHDEQAEPTHEK